MDSCAGDDAPALGVLPHLAGAVGRVCRREGYSREPTEGACLLGLLDYYLPALDPYSRQQPLYLPDLLRLPLSLFVGAQGAEALYVSRLGHRDWGHCARWSLSLFSS